MKKLIPSVAGLALAAGAGLVAASSHREAPQIAEDQYADNTDVYAFISPGDSERLTIVANYVPLLLPPSGPNFYKFAEDVRYDIHVDNDGDAIDDIIYRFNFTNHLKNGNTFLYNTGPVDSIDSPNLNVTQTYDVQRLDLKTGKRAKILSNVPVAPWNVGNRSFPDYEKVALQAVRTASDGTKVFAGPRDEPFFVDLHVFDLLGVGGAPTTDGINVMSIVLEVPITQVAANGTRPPAGTKGKKSQVGIHATAARPQLRILRKTRDNDEFGGFVQVSRLGWPLVNEVIIPLKDKDKYNHSKPVDDVSNFGAYIVDPELTKLLIGVLPGLNCKPTPAGGRLDIVGLLSPNGTTAADILRVNIEVGQKNSDSHFPNGRALEDDVVKTELTVLCGAPADDGVTKNDKDFTTTFPYLASPASGNPKI